MPRKLNRITKCSRILILKEVGDVLNPTSMLGDSVYG